MIALASRELDRKVNWVAVQKMKREEVESGLTFLLTVLARVPEILGEGVMFGSGVVHRGVFSCLQAGGGRVVTEEVWMSWASREPPELVWLTTSYRQSASSKVQHAVRCSACQVMPIMGMR